MFLYQEFNLLISAIHFPDITNVCTFLISTNRILDSNNWNSWYQHIELLILRNQLLISWNSNCWYQESGVEQEGATCIRQGGHHVGHWPTFLVRIYFMSRTRISETRQK